MSDLKNIPIQDSYNTKLTQQWNGGTGTIYVQSVPTATIGSGAVMYIVVDPGKSNQQVAVVDSYNASNKTLNVSSITVSKGTGVSYTQKSHSVGAVVRISDSYGFWSDIQTAVNSKLDTGGGNGLEYADTTARDTALGGDGVATKNYRMVKAGSNYYNYNLSAGQRQIISTGTAPANATTTTTGIVELATSAEYQDNVMLDPYRPLVVESRMSVFDHYPTTNLTANDLFSLGLNTYGSKGRISYSDLKTNLNAGLSFAKNFGTGSDGAIGAGGLTITGSNNTYILKQYTTFAPGANTVTITPTNCILHIKVQGNCNLTGTTFSFAGKGGAGGVHGLSNATNNGANSISTIGRIVGGKAYGRTAEIYTGSAMAGIYIPYLVTAGCGSGGGSGGSQYSGESGADGGNGGGCVILEVGGTLTFSSTTMNFNGTNGTAISGGPNGGGGGGGGGSIVILHNGTVSGSPTVNVAGGSGAQGSGTLSGEYRGFGGSSIINPGALDSANILLGTNGGAGLYYIGTM